MTFEDVMLQLEEMGTAQNRKIYQRHGACAPLFGVSYANLGVLKKKIKGDQELAIQLWESGNMDAMSLAMMVIDGAALSPERVEQWISPLPAYYMLSDALVNNVVVHHDARKRMTRWTQTKQEATKRAGYSLLVHFARAEKGLPQLQFTRYITRIEEEIHAAPNRAKQMMNIALLNLGLRDDDLRSLALAAAQRIGKVDVDHGDTSCKTYDVYTMLRDDNYVAKARASNMRRVKKKR